jgi:hypothetical protein
MKYLKNIMKVLVPDIDYIKICIDLIDSGKIREGSGDERTDVVLVMQCFY